MRTTLIPSGVVALAWVTVWYAAGSYTCDSDCPGSFYVLWITWFVLALILGLLGVAILVMWIDQVIAARKTRGARER